MLTRQAAISRLEALHGATSIGDLLGRFDAAAPDFAVRGVAICAPAPETGTQLDYSADTGSFSHVQGPGLLASIPRSHRLVLTPDGPAWEAAGEGAWPLIRHAAILRGPSSGTLVPVGSAPLAILKASFLTEYAEPDEHMQVHLMMLADAVYTSQLRLAARDAGGAVHLSPREREVLEWLAQGKSAEEVGIILSIASATVMFHYRNVALRLGTLNRTHTIVEAMRRGLLPLTPYSPERDSPIDDDGSFAI